MSIQADLYTKLAATSAITALASTRLYPDQVPASAALPFVHWQIVSRPGHYYIAGETGIERIAFQFTCCASSSTARDSLGDAVRGAVETQARATWGSSTVRACFVENETDTVEWIGGGDEEAIWTRTIDAIAWVVEA